MPAPTYPVDHCPMDKSARLSNILAFVRFFEQLQGTDSQDNRVSETFMFAM